jgi:GNAT superfamily N-acetyltransferase
MVPVLGVVLRPARPEEAPALTALALRSKGHWGYDAAFLAACRQELTVDPVHCDGTRVVVAERAGAVLGFYRVAGQPPIGELTDLFIDPPAIGEGVGTGLLTHARHQASSRGFTVLIIDADPHAEGFYLHAGARRVGQIPSATMPDRALPRLHLSLTTGP